MKSKSLNAVIIIFLFAFIVMPVTASVYFSSSAHQIITKGDTFSVSGIGARNGTVAIWIIGRNYIDCMTVAPDRNGNFSISLKPTATEKFSIGQYAIVFQDPGPGSMREIELGTDSNKNPTIMNRGKIIAKLGPREDLERNIQSIVAILMNAAEIQGVDDTFLPKYFFVEEPSILFYQLNPMQGSRLPDQTTGDPIVISGTTNIGAENFLKAGIYTTGTNALITSKTIPVRAGVEMNYWSYELEDPGLPPGNYYLTLGKMISNTTSIGTAPFTVMTPVPATSPTVYSLTQDIPEQEGVILSFLVGSMVLVVVLIIYAAVRK